MFYKIYGWFCIVLGGLAVFNGVDENSTSAFAGGVMFITAGVLIIDLLKSKK